MELVPLGTFTVRLARNGIFDVGDGPAGRRMIFEIESARFEGDRLSASSAGSAAADWSLSDARGTISLDVRCLLKTDDGALVYVAYTGRGDFSAGPGTAPLYTAITFETSHDDYRWLNSVQAVSKGTFKGPLTIAYDVHELR